MERPPHLGKTLPWAAGSSYHWQGVWGGECQSPRLPDWNWSCHLTCCVGGEAKELMSTGGRGLQDLSSDMGARPLPRKAVAVPCPEDSLLLASPKIAQPHPQADTWS